jgi:hypothetical protein
MSTGWPSSTIKGGPTSSLNQDRRRNMGAFRKIRKTLQKPTS